ncbi:MAG TPA: DUF1697 domain-containing protein [Candidatus Sulfotelmatobacter sp.]|nr:DUF1697 domain-containing protein [Candidatus Sulfotelmatobacter sp.]
MPVLISMLRGVNVGPHNRIKMDALRALYESLKFKDVRTYVQSGNVIFRSNDKNTDQSAKKIQSAIQQTFGINPDVVVRSPQQLRQTIEANPFGKRVQTDPGKVLVTFLESKPAADAAAGLRKLKACPEELHLQNRELFIYFPNGAGKSKLPWSSLAKLLNTTGTARNWNSVLRLLEIAEELEAIEQDL